MIIVQEDWAKNNDLLIGNWWAFTKLSEEIRLSTINEDPMDESPKVSVVLPHFGREREGH